jgi:hypothetical protein
MAGGYFLLDAYSPPEEDSIFDTAESFDSELTTEGLVAGCGSLFPGSAVRF